jgi:hypothetical protein
MRKSPHFRWIEEAEARQVRALALHQYSPSEPHVSIVSEPSSTWPVRLRTLIPGRNLLTSSLRALSILKPYTQVRERRR